MEKIAFCVSALKNLYEREFYKCLNLTFDCKFDAQYLNVVMDLCDLAPVKKLTIAYCGDDDDDMNIDVLTKKLINLEQVYLNVTTTDHVLSFVRFCKRIKTIKIGFIKHRSILELDLLNKERKKVVGARSLTLFLSDDVYFDVKNQLKNSDLSHIKFRRFEENY